MIFIIFIIFILIIICAKIHGKNIGGNEDNNSVELTTEIMSELSQYDESRVKKYLELNNLDEIIEKKNINSVKGFFEKENISQETFLTGAQKEILFQSGKKKLTNSALKMTDQELIQAYQDGESIFV